MSVKNDWWFYIIQLGGHPLSLFLIPALIGLFIGFDMCDDKSEIVRCMGQGLSIGCFIGVLLATWTEKKYNDIAPIICSIAGIVFGSTLAFLGEYSISEITFTVLLFGFLGATSRFWIKGISIL